MNRREFIARINGTIAVALALGGKGRGAVPTPKPESNSERDRPFMPVHDGLAHALLTIDERSRPDFWRLPIPLLDVLGREVLALGSRGHYAANSRATGQPYILCGVDLVPDLRSPPARCELANYLESLVKANGTDCRVLRLPLFKPIRPFFRPADFQKPTRGCIDIVEIRLTER